jgi:tRNA threonylcarbamoyladenosine biosynthesis protein TsaB
MSENVALKTTKKTILAIETSGVSCGVCIYRNDKDYLMTSLVRDRSHAAKLASLIESALKSFDVSLAEIGSVAVSNGPGSFTGLRVGLSTAKGICSGAQIPLVLVPTTEAVALEVSSILERGTTFITATKVNTTEFYVTKFKTTSSGYEIIIPTLVLEVQRIKEILVSDEFLVSDKNWFDSEKYVNLMSPNPMLVAKWASDFGKEVAPDNIDFIEPYYFKEFIIKRK